MQIKFREPVNWPAARPPGPARPAGGEGGLMYP